MIHAFHNRIEAGRMLAEKLTQYAHRPEVLVLALPRGGVPVAFEIALALGAPLDVLLVRKLGVPDQEELAMGAIASGGLQVLNESVVTAFEIDTGSIEAMAKREQLELDRREGLFRAGRPALVVEGRTIILVDDGVATGATLRAAIAVLRKQKAERIVVATPTAAPSTAAKLRTEVDEWVCLMTPVEFSSVGQWYEDFSLTRDQEVCELLEKSRQSSPISSA